MRPGVAALALALAACATPAHRVLSVLPEEERARFWRCETFAWEACRRDEECRNAEDARRRRGEILARLFVDAKDEAARRRILESMGCPADVIEARSIWR